MTPTLDAVASQGGSEASTLDAFDEEQAVLAQEAQLRDALAMEHAARQAQEAQEQQDMEEAAQREAFARGEHAERADAAERQLAEEARQQAGSSAAGPREAGARSPAGRGTEGDGNKLARYASILPRSVGVAKLADTTGTAVGSSPWAKAAKPLGFGLGVWNSYEGMRKMSDGEDHAGDGLLQTVQGFSGMAGPWSPHAGALSTGIMLGRSGVKRTGIDDDIAGLGGDVYEACGGGALGNFCAGSTMTAASIASVPYVAGAGLYSLGEDAVDLGSDAVDYLTPDFMSDLF